MNKKRIIALFAAVVLVVSSFATVSAAVFPDIESRHSWAEDAIEDMVGRGILKGYTDGTFKPDRSVTRLETLIIASRIMGVDEEENKDYRAAAVKKYDNILASYDIDFKDEVAYLMYWGILTQDELTTYISDSGKNQPLKRHEAAVFLTKLIGGEDEALENSVIVLDFSDASSIPSSAKAYVKYIFDVGLMNGMEDNKFNPSSELTRAMISTIMYRAENYMEEEVVTGTVSAVNKSILTLTVNGEDEDYEIPENATVKIDANMSDIADLSINQVVRLHIKRGEVRFIDAISSNLYYTVSGVITTIAESSGVRKITIKNASGTNTYTISPDSCEYLVNNKISNYSDISRNAYATLTIQAGYITKISVETGSKSISGKIDGISIKSDFVAITILLNDGTTVDYALNEEVVITRNNSKVTVSELATGDSVTATISNGGIDKIVASSLSKSVSGTISKIVISSSSSVTIKTSTDEIEYGVTSDTTFIVDGQQDCSIYDLRVGATADVRLDSTNIKSISTNSAVVSPTLTGVITYIHPTSYVMGLQVTDAATGDVEEIQTVVDSDVKITDTTSSRISSFKALQPGMTIVVVGSSKYGVYEVDQIIVTAGVK